MIRIVLIGIQMTIGIMNVVKRTIRKGLYVIAYYIATVRVLERPTTHDIHGVNQNRSHYMFDYMVNIPTTKGRNYA
jgi:hypothetical protein